MSKKNLSKLIPVKKNVIDGRTNTPIERTYYVDPNKDIDNKNKTEPKQQSEEKQDIRKNNDKKEKLTLKNDKIDGVDISKIKDFDDFGKQGVDPDVARSFFCRM